MTDVHVIGTGMTPQGRLAEGPAGLATSAVRAALDDADISPSRLGLVLASNALGGLLNEQECVRGQSWLTRADLGGVHVVNVENGCAGGASALHLACAAVRAGGGPVLVVGVEKMWTGDRAATLDGIENCLSWEERAELRRTIAGSAGSVFMGFNASWTLEQVRDRGHTVEQIAHTAVKARAHGARNPLAQHREVVTVEQVLDSPTVSGPLTRLMCSSFTDGAAALVLAADEPGTPRVRASVARTGDATLDYHGRLAEVGKLCFDAAELGPDDVDVVELHDATAAEELFALESLGFYDVGDAGAASVRGETTFGTGATVVNPSGGLVARGHPIGATGVAQAVEIVTQLRDRAGARQVDGATIGVAVNSGGIIGGDVGAMVGHVFEA